jgi:glycosyltransferase involved in cell wall biosynthesis
MQICMVTSSPIPPTEGIGHYVWNLSHLLAKKGHQVQIITRGQCGKPSYEELEEIPVWRPRFYPLYPLHVHLHGLFVQCLVRRLEPQVDIFHLHTPLPPPIRSQRPLLVTAHSSRVEAAKILRVTDLISLLTRLQVPISIGIERRIFASAAQIVTVAQSVAAGLQDYDLGRKPIAVLGNGVDTRIFCADRQDLSAQPGETYLLAAGRLAPAKGFEDLIKAMDHVVQLFPTAHLRIAGAGSLGQRLRAKVRQMGLDRAIIFLGHIGERTEMVELYRHATIFAHAAHYEGLPTVLLEAMACGKAVVSTAVSGALDVIEDGVNGLLVPVGSPERLASAVCHLLSDAQLRARLGRAARRTVETRFSWEAVGSNYLHSYQALLNRMGPGAHPSAKTTSSDMERSYA